MATRVEIVDYDDTWPQRFTEAQQNLRAILTVPLTCIDHVGSTAVPYLAAKPLIDIDITVANAACIADACIELESAGYQSRGARHRDGVFAYLLAGDPGYRVYLCPPQSETHLNRMRFRDSLRQDRDLANAYAALKQQLAALYRYDGDAYTQAKSTFIAKAIQMPQ
jgi:GrpB-like predicted nucleotidyltransferase (UPF0157 family)